MHLPAPPDLETRPVINFPHQLLRRSNTSSPLLTHYARCLHSPLRHPSLQGRRQGQHWPFHQRGMGRWFFREVYRVRCPISQNNPLSHLPLSLSSVVNPTTGKLLTKVVEGAPEDVDVAVEAAQKAFDTTWGLNCPAHQRGRLLNKFADIMESRFDELCAVEALDNGSFPLSYLTEPDTRLTPELAGPSVRQNLPVGEERGCLLLHQHHSVLRWLGRQDPRSDHRD